MAEQNQSGDNIFTVLKFTIPIIIVAGLLIGGWITNFSFGGKLTEPEVKINTSPIIADSDSLKIKTVEHSQTVSNDVTDKEEEVFDDTEWLNGKWELVIYSDKCSNNVSKLFYRLNLTSSKEFIEGNGNKFKDEDKKGKISDKYLIPCVVQGKKLGNRIKLILEEGSTKRNETYQTNISIDRILKNNTKMTGIYKDTYNNCMGFLEINKIEE